jgi:two-component system nitrate/nitrite response regulator NarL
MITSTVSPIRLLIVIPVRLYREGLMLRLREHERFEIVGTAQKQDEALSMAHDAQPDVVIMDASASHGRHFMQTMIAACPDARILALGVEETLPTIMECTLAGARGYFDANGSMDELIDAIERIVAGELTCSPRIVAALLQRTVQPVLLSGTAGLTRRQQQVLTLLERGLANKQIATALNIAEATVKNHVHQVLEKLRVPSRAQAAAYIRSA